MSLLSRIARDRMPTYELCFLLVDTGAVQETPTVPSSAENTLTTVKRVLQHFPSSFHSKESGKRPENYHGVFRLRCFTPTIISESGLGGRGGEREKWNTWGAPSLHAAHCLYFHLSSHRFHTWGFARAKNWETRVFGSSQTPPSSHSHTDQLEALTGEKPYYRSRQSYTSEENPWPFQALENVLSFLCSLAVEK